MIYVFSIFYLGLQQFQMSEENVWKRQGHLLQEAAGSISTLRKEINKETEIDVAVQLSIKQKIDSLKQNATLIANRLENQKHKNAELEAIIRYIQSKMEQQKLMEATNRDNISFQSLTSLDGRYKKLQYDLSHLSGKLNRMCENVETKKSKISQNRTERVIDSGIFRNIEKELITSEFKFKKLLIQKIKFKNEYEKLLSQYQQLKKKAESDVQKEGSKVKANKHSSRTVTQNTSPQQKKFIQIQSKQSKAPSHYRSAQQAQIQSQIEQQQQRKAILIQKLLSDLRLQNCEQLLDNFQNIQKINDSCFNQMNNYSDQIGQIQKYLSVMEHSKKANKMKFYQQKKEITKNSLNLQKKREIKAKVQQTQSQVDQQVEQIAAFLNQKEFIEFQLKVDLKPLAIEAIQPVNFEAIIEGLRKIEDSAQQYLRPQKIKSEDEHQCVTSRAASQQKLLDMLNKVKYDQCMKVMKKQEFKQEYSKLVKVNSNSKRGQIAHSTSKLSNHTYRR